MMCHFPLAQTVKHLPAMQETQVQSLGWEDLLEKEMATHFSILAWKIPWMEEPGRATVHGVAKNWTRLSDFTFLSYYFFRIKSQIIHIYPSCKIESCMMKEMFYRN